MRKFIAVQFALLITVSLWALEPDDKAIVGVWLLDGDYKDESGNGNKGKDSGDLGRHTTKIDRTKHIKEYLEKRKTQP